VVRERGPSGREAGERRCSVIWMDARRDEAMELALLMRLASDGREVQQTWRYRRNEQNKISLTSILQSYLQVNTRTDCVTMVERRGRRDEGNAAGSCESGVNVQVIVRCRYVRSELTTLRRMVHIYRCWLGARLTGGVLTA
jgi:hypothetical protein